MSLAKLTETEFVRFVGKNASSIEVREFVRSIGKDPIVTSYEEGARNYYTFAEEGLDIVFDDGVATAVHMYGAAAEEHAVCPYIGPLPHGLSFADSRNSVLAKLGQPAKSHPGRDDPRPGIRIRPWVKFNFDTYALHVQFTQDCSRIELVTLQATS